MKRKGGQHRPDKQKQPRADKEFVIREGAGFTQLELAHNQSVTLTGSAQLEVAAGCISVYGALVTPESGPLTLHAPSKFGRALQLTAVSSTEVAPPSQPSHSPVQAVLQPVSSQSEQQQQQQQLGYSITLAAAEDGTPTWQVPAAWSQAVGDLTAAGAGAATQVAAAGGSSGGGGGGGGGGRHIPLVVAVAGSKGSGKSAFARLLVNSLLAQGAGGVAYLDLDPGQPEFTPPGLLSLHLLHRPVFGPRHLQHHQPLAAYFQGDTSSQSEPGRYLQAVQALLQRYAHLNATDMLRPAAAAAAAGVRGGGGDVLQEGLLPPLVINTPGWITGLGLDLLAEVLRCAQPTHVVQLQTSNAKKNLPAAAWWVDAAAGAAGAGGVMPAAVLQVPSVCGAGGAGQPDAAASAGGVAVPADSMPSAPSGDTTQTGAAMKGSAKGVSAATARNLSWLAWAQQVAAANPTADGNSSTSTADLQDPTGAQGGLTAAGKGVVGEDFAGAAAALAAAVPMVVSLQDMQVEVLHAQVDRAELPVALNGAVVGLAATSTGFNSTSGAQPGLLYECLGLGLVRAVDGPQQELYVLTDLSEQQLQRVDLLQVGKLELADKLLEGRSFASPYQGLFCLTSTATGAGPIRSRNNLLRSSQLLS